MYAVFLAAPLSAAFAFLKASRFELKKKECLVMVMYLLLGVLVIDLFLVVMGDGTKQPK